MRIHLMNVIILAARVSGNDGVSLEAQRWREILQRMGHKVNFLAGALDRSGLLVPELYFNSPEIVRIHDRVIHSRGSYREIEAKLFELSGKIEGKLREVFNNGRKPDFLIVPNILSLPMHFPLAVAVTRVIGELKIPTIARHHDFWWERERFLRSSMFEFFKRWFPPNPPNIQHVVINSIAKEELMRRAGIKAELIWDCFDFSSKLNQPDSYSKNWRADFGVRKDDIVFLQATRIVPRKRIELSIELVRKLNNPKIILVIAGHSGDEGREYELKLRKAAKDAGIRFKFIGRYVNSKRRIISFGNHGNGRQRRVYTLWDCFVNCDFVTYPTMVEGFGNQFVESVYFKKPIIVTPYPVFKKDIEPLGFQVIKMPDRVSDSVLKETQDLINNPTRKEQMVKANFKIGEKYFDYSWVEEKLRKILNKFDLS